MLGKIYFPLHFWFPRRSMGAMGTNHSPYKSRSSELWVSDLLCISLLEGLLHGRPLGPTQSVSDSVHLEWVPAKCHGSSPWPGNMQLSPQGRKKREKSEHEPPSSPRSSLVFQKAWKIESKREKPANSKIKRKRGEWGSNHSGMLLAVGD